MVKTTTAVITLLISLWVAPSAVACACRPHTVRDDVANASRIYVARVVGAREVTPSDPQRYPYVIATLSVVETIKGAATVEDTREVEFQRPCGVEVVISSSYVVFEQEEGTTGRCEGTFRLTRESPRGDEKHVQKIRDLARENH